MEVSRRTLVSLLQVGYVVAFLALVTGVALMFFQSYAYGALGIVAAIVWVIFGDYIRVNKLGVK